MDSETNRGWRRRWRWRRSSKAALLAQALLRATDKLFPPGGSMSELAVLLERVLLLEAVAVAQ